SPSTKPCCHPIQKLWSCWIWTVLLRGWRRSMLERAKIVELRFFRGTDCRRNRKVLTISPNTVLNDWIFSKSWLFRGMSHHEWWVGQGAKRTDDNTDRSRSNGCE